MEIIGVVATLRSRFVLAFVAYLNKKLTGGVVRRGLLGAGNIEPVGIHVCEPCDVFANFQAGRLWLPVPCVLRQLRVEHHPGNVEGTIRRRRGRQLAVVSWC